jgi:hypothetical protein
MLTRSADRWFENENENENERSTFVLVLSERSERFSFSVVPVTDCPETCPTRP